MDKDRSIEESLALNKLRAELEETREELLRLLNDRFILNNIVAPRLMFVYETIFGDLEIELINKNREASKLERRLELISIKLKRGEKLTKKTFEFIDEIVERESVRNGDTFKSRKTRVSSGINNGISNGSNLTRKDIPKLYRGLVKKLHPDAVGAETEHFQKYWDCVQDAYRSKNARRLKLFYQTLCGENYEPVAAESDDLQEKIKREIRELRINIAAEKRRIERLKRTEPFTIEEKINDKFWIARRKRILREKLFQADRQIRRHRRTLSSLANFNGYEFRGETRTFENSFYEASYAGGR